MTPIKPHKIKESWKDRSLNKMKNKCRWNKHSCYKESTLKLKKKKTSTTICILRMS